MFDLVLHRPAVRFLESREPSEREEIRRLLEIIAQDPFWDNRFKFPFPVPPAIVSMYDSRQFKIVYHVLDNYHIAVWAIGYSGDKPRLA